MAAEPGRYSASAHGGSTPRKLLGEVLVEQGVISAEQLDRCLAIQRESAPVRRRLGSIVVAEALASESDVARALARALQLEMVDLARTVVVPDVARLLPRAIAERYGVLPLERVGAGVRIAVVDPTNVVSIDDIRLHLGISELHLVVATETQLRSHLARMWSLHDDAGEVVMLLDDASDSDDFDLSGLDRSSDAAPIVRLVDVLLNDAVRVGASDIHVEPQLDDVRIRFRVDGMLRDIMTVPKGARSALVSRFKIISGLDISERRRPQDGRSRMQVGDTYLDARVSTLPSLHGEKVVVRLLARSQDVVPLPQIGFEDEQLASVLNAATSPQGLILITGPTGSGKTSTLYAAVAQMKTPDKNIVTLEDPVEIAVPGVVQVQVHEKAGLTFARGLRSVLRQDPDIILVGEVRDMETAELALRSSLTGHLVLTTLHTNDAVAAVTRLVDMGVEPFLISSAVSLVVAQRLVRRPCADCSAPYKPSPRTLSLLGLSDRDLDGATPMRGRGCDLCGDTGYRGRVAVFEVLPVTASLRAILMSGGDERAVAVAARSAGMKTMRESAILKAMRGQTTFEEVLRATPVETRSGEFRCPTCSRGLAEDMVCCPWCSTVVDSARCANCARALEPGWRTCPWCHTPVPGGEALLPTVAAGSSLPRVLVVDDEVSIGQFVEAALVGSAEVEGAVCAEDGLRLLAEKHFDLLILDMRLPDLTGVEVIRLLRADPRTSVLPILLLTGTADPAVQREAELAGADDYLPKPVDPDLLETRVMALVSKTASATH